VSIGLAYCELSAIDVPEMLAQADQALYFAKEHGRNRVEVASLEMVMQRKAEGVDAQADATERAKSAAA
jgi:predicted signal transduction protein with EAL and GGDEF domain